MGRVVGGGKVGFCPVYNMTVARSLLFAALFWSQYQSQSCAEGKRLMGEGATQTRKSSSNELVKVGQPSLKPPPAASERVWTGTHCPLCITAAAA